MRHISLIIPKENFSMASMATSFEVFSFVNRYYTDQGKPPFFDIALVCISNDHTDHERNFVIHPNAGFRDRTKYNKETLSATADQLAFSGRQV